MNKAKYILYTLLACFTASCSNEEAEHPTTMEPHGEEMVVQAVIGNTPQTRATYPISGNDHYIGREVFVGGDKMVLTNMKRTEKTIETYHYTNLPYSCNESGAWSRTTDTDPDRVYWTDNTSDHTVTGYSVPRVWSEDKWVKNDNVYTGQFSSTTDETNGEYIDFTDSLKLAQEDLLITDSTGIKAQTGGSVAILHYKHALSSIRVIVNIQNFAATDKVEDAKTKVSDLVLLNQPWKYKWDNTITEFQGINIPGWGTTDNTQSTDGRKPIHTWIPVTEGTGTNSAKRFVFYSLVVPGKRDTQMTFSVTYPKALNPAETETHTYSASLENVQFRPGYCTTINITLDHANENMTIGAEYIDWEQVETPDQSTLKKNETYLDHVERSKITIIGDSKATEDDATWLYQDGDVVKDIYGNIGTESAPFTIKTAEQLLSFAYEVKNGRDFAGQFIKLDAGLLLQPFDGKKTLTWPGIGDATHPFNGHLDGGVRLIKKLNGNPLFLNIGPKAHIEQLLLEDVSNITGSGAFANTNAGIICACKAETVRSYDNGDSKPITITSSNPVGLLVGSNSGIIIASHTIGHYTTTATTVGGLAGNNTGAIVASYAAVSTPSSATTRGGIAGSASENSIIGCFYNNELTTSTLTTEQSEGKTTVGLQKSDIIGDKDASDGTTLNAAINIWAADATKWPASVTSNYTEDQITALKEHFAAKYYVYHVADYPWVY